MQYVACTASIVWGTKQNIIISCYEWINVSFFFRRFVSLKAITASDNDGYHFYFVRLLYISFISPYIGSSEEKPGL